jgi:HSP20 family protein
VGQRRNQQRSIPAWTRKEIYMEVRFENGWTGRNWLFDPRGLVLFRASDSTPRHMTPPVDVVEDKDAYHFYFEMPGLSNESINARVEGGQLVVEAERKQTEWPQETKVRVAERSYRQIYRAFELPDDTSTDRIEAIYKDGVLAVTIAKKPESKSAKIVIN